MKYSLDVILIAIIYLGELNVMFGDLLFLVSQYNDEMQATTPFKTQAPLTHRHVST